MTTGSFQDWAGSIAEIGPIYPFVGLEWLMVVAGFAFWITWHIVQIRRESAQLKEEEQYFKSKE